MARSDRQSDLIPLRTAVRAWFGVSLRTFGGPAGQIAVMHRELVDERRWIGEQRFLHALSFCTVLPGPEAQQLAIYLGWLLNGTVGGLIAGVLFVLPGYLALMALAAIYAQWGATVAVTAVFAGLAPAVLAIVSQAVVRIARRSLANRALQCVAVGAFLALFCFAVPFPLVIAMAATLAVAGRRFFPAAFTPRKPATTAKGDAGEQSAPLIADDALHGEPPSWGRALRVVAVGLTMWFAPIAVAAAWLGRHHVIVREGLFFSGTAVVTFGGAYAVLSFVAQRAVESFHWLAPGEMINGLALAETTPGPLIMVVQYVAFLGAFRHPGSLNPWVAALIGSTLTVWATFVPCFLFVFLGAPHVEALRRNTRLTTALSGVTAAVVGVIANLSVYFALHTLFGAVERRTPGPLRVDIPVVSTLNVRALMVAALVFVAVFRWKLDTLKVLALCAVVGGVLHLLFA